MESFIGAALVAAASGLAFIAYNHPTGYKRLVWILFLIYAVFGAVITIWWLLAPLTIAAWVPLVGLGIFCYVWLLELLPNFTTKDDKEDR